MSLLPFGLHGRSLYLAWRVIAQCAVGALTVIKLNIRINATLELCLRGIILSVEFFFFQRGEKGFCHRIVMGISGGRKGLCHRMLTEQLLKTVRGILGASVAVKDKASFWRALLPCHFESGCNELRANASQSVWTSY